MGSLPADGPALERRIRQALEARLHELAPDAELPSLVMQPPERVEHGDLSIPCHPLARVLRNAPQRIADDLAGHLAAQPEIASAEAVNGFLNLRLEPSTYFAAMLRPAVSAPDRYGLAAEPTGQRVMVEFSSPNTNKPQHLGHIRNNLLGAAVSNLLEAHGDTVTRANLINNRGIHICKSMLAYQQHGEGHTPEADGIKGDLLVGGYYVRFEREYAAEKARIEEQLAAEGVDDPAARGKLADKRSTLLAQAHELLRRWEAGDPEVVALWERMNGWVYDGFDQTYRRLGIRFDKMYYESDTYLLGRETVLEAQQRGVVDRGDDGSVSIDLSGDKLDRKLLLRSDGTSLYITQDIGTAQLKQSDHDLHRSIYVVGSEQDYHFKVLFLTLKRMGFEWADGCHHLSYGMIYLPEGKMKSREGKVVDADDLMEQVVQSVRDRMLERDAELRDTDRECATAVAEHSGQALAEIDTIAEAVGMGALKFYVLKFGPRKDFTFVPEESISLQGDTGPYVQFAYTRIVGILRKAGVELGDDQAALLERADLGALGNAEERVLASLVGRFPDEIQMAAENLNPAAFCQYLLTVAQAFHRFVHDHQVLRADSEGLRDARLALCLATATVIQRGLGLMGIEAPPRM
jgi:arginyl-tRNA synthetase